LRKPGHTVYVSDATDLPSFLEPDGPLPPSVIRFTEYLGSIIAGTSQPPSDELARENLARCKAIILEREKAR
jgi:hypothetical protein